MLVLVSMQPNCVDAVDYAKQNQASSKNGKAVMRCSPKRSLGLSCVAVLMAACAHEPSSATSIVESDWQLVSIGTQAAAPTREDRHPSLSFVVAEGVIQGSGGCNRYSATYKLSADSIEIGPPLRTKMACAPEISQQEDRFFDALTAVRSWRMEAQDLVLGNESGTVAMRFSAGTPAAAD